MKRPDIESLKTLCEDATPAPWKSVITYHEGEYQKYIKRIEIVQKEGDTEYCLSRMDWSNPVKANAEFIVKARREMPKLIKYIEQLEQRNKVLTQALTSIHNATLPSAVITKSKLVQIHDTAKGALNND